MTRYQLTVEAEKLSRVSALRMGAPYAVVTVSGGPRDGEVLGETEVSDTLDPRWIKVIYVDTDPSVYLPINVEIFDQQDGRENRKMEEASFEVTSINESKAHTVYEELKGGTIIRATVVESLQGSLMPDAAVKLQFRLLDVKNIESGFLGLGRTDPFIEVQKKNVDLDAGIIQWIPVYRTEHVDDNLNPVFKAFQTTAEELCYGDPEWPLRLVLYDWQRKGKHREMGVYETCASLANLQANVATGGNADRESALPVDKKDITTALIIVLKAEVSVG
mmetsp:Transcript_22217/g.36786  ORF Transcript_22217/g.36786 Transcript_22217/m.36786 type:complete len:276 (+) Transcript_22217:158-985(+)|eukprot:CAMPEP_0119017324 /NCGR_PEP_ID=MMETSP1176-20130426/16182_1 /TAXON_ID=265551 /ORGANISM="Synedropsis recta cf, Strain CCMP1620" /LENGTH=275 /DNA_ID=CAMNT_0006971015 /DNA_START=129 /DNA_END=956 /DNA_ORIENTATION=-